MNARKPSVVPPVILLLVISLTLVELALQGADLGLWSTTRLRIQTYLNGAFWPGLMRGWTPNYAAQPYAMFVTYAFLHGGLAHLIVNGITLFSLGSAIVRDVGQVGFLVVYAVSTFTGAAVFAVLTPSFQPMVGASGALFGLAGALVIWNIIYTFRHSHSLAFKIATVVWPISVLIILNVAMYYAFDKNVAWETHLGGFLGGALTAILMRSNDESDVSA